MSALTCDERHVLEALADRGGGAKTPTEIYSFCSHVFRMRAARRDAALGALAARGLIAAERVVTRLTHGKAEATRTEPGWRPTAAGLAALGAAAPTT